MKYFLKPYFEIVPMGTKVKVSSTLSENIYVFNESDEVPSLLDLFCALKNGVSEKLVLPSYKELLNKLLKLEVVELNEDNKAPKTDFNDYYDLLNNCFVGPGKIVNALSSKKFNNKFTVAEAVGFGPKFIQYQPSLNYGWGCDPSSKMAKIKAIVECIERYALADYHVDSLKRASWRELKNSSLSPTQLNTTCSCFEKAKEIYWDELYGVNSKEKSIYVPLDFINHPVDYWRLGRLPVCPMNLSGIAGHQSKEAAIVNGLLELCEHEALMVTWFGRRNTRTIDPATLDEESIDYIRILTQKGWRIVIKDISLDLVPVVMVIGLGSKGKRALTIGSNAAFTLKYACKKAILEVARTVLFEDVRSFDNESIKEEEVDDVLTHAQYYADYNRLKGIEWLWEDVNYKDVNACDTLTFGEYKNCNLEDVLRLWKKYDRPETYELNYLIELFGEHSLEVFVRDITPPGVKKLNVPLVIMRVLVPEMTRLVVGYDQKSAPTKRYKKLLKEYENQISDRLPKVHPFS